MKDFFIVAWITHIYVFGNVSRDTSLISWKNDHEMNWEERKVIDAGPYIYARKINKG